LSYKVNKIIVLQDYGKTHVRIAIETEKTIDLPFVAGDYQDLVTADQMKSNVFEVGDTSLFNKANLARISEDVGENGILYLDLEENCWLGTILPESEDIVIDLSFRDDKRLLYSFFNATDQKTISLILKKVNDKGDTWSQIQSNSSDPIYRQYFIKKALETGKSEKVKEIESHPELMTADQVAKYLQKSVKTIRNNTSDGKIPVEYAGGSPRYRKSKIDKWLDGKKV